MRAAKKQDSSTTIHYIEENHDNQVYTSKKQKTVGTTGLARGEEVRLKRTRKCASNAFCVEARNPPVLSGRVVHLILMRFGRFGRIGKEMKGELC